MNNAKGTKDSWYATTIAGGSQGLVYDENTGANIAVIYDPKHTSIVAEAPNLLRALRECTTEAGSHAMASGDPEVMARRLREIDRIACAAMAEVEGADGY